MRSSMPLLEFREKPSGNWLVVSSRRCGRCYSPGVWLFHPHFQFLSGQLEAFYDSDLPLSQFPRILPFGFCQPRLYPSYHCHHIHIIIHVSLIHVSTWCSLLSRFIICLLSCRPFCFLPCNVPRHTHIFSTPLRAGSMPIITSPLSNLIHVNVIPIHSPRCACVCLCFIRSSHSPSLIVILPSSLLHLPYAFYSSVLCPL